jgi:hypothetical protein
MVSDEIRGILSSNFVDITKFRFLDEVDKVEAIRTPVPWSIDTIREHAESHFLVFVPSVSLRQLVDISEMGNLIADRWFVSDTFATTKRASGWHLMLKTTIPDSGDKWWLEQRAMLSASEIVPDATTLAFAVVAYFLQNDIRLFETEYVRTSSERSSMVRVFLAKFDNQGLHFDHWNEDHYKHIKITSELKPEES